MKTPRNFLVMKSAIESSSTRRRKAMVRPGRQPIVPSTLCAGIEYSARTFSSQSAQRVRNDRPGSRMR